MDTFNCHCLHCSTITKYRRYLFYTYIGFSSPVSQCITLKRRPRIVSKCMMLWAVLITRLIPCVCIDQSRSFRLINRIIFVWYQRTMPLLRWFWIRFSLWWALSYGNDITIRISRSLNIIKLPFHKKQNIYKCA